MDNRTIGIFDSGVGGLSILLEIQKLLPKESFVFVADQAFVPYGKKSKDELIGRVSRIIEFLKEKNVKAVVAACNTATVYTIEEMRQKFDMPIIGTVPVVKTLGAISKTRKAAVFSTPATAESTYLAGLIEKFAPDMEILRAGGSRLEELIEDGDLNSRQIREILETTLPPLVERGVDAIALGCTHYPFLRDRIERIVGPNVTVVDSGGAVARRLKQVLENNGTLASQKGEDEYYTTGDEARFKRVAEQLMRTSLSRVAHIEL
jgi:glutamate racemase